MISARAERTIDELGIPDELTPWALRRFEKALDERGRERCSVEDFWLGYRAALVELRAQSQFKNQPTPGPVAG